MRTSVVRSTSRVFYGPPIPVGSWSPPEVCTTLVEDVPAHASWLRVESTEGFPPSGRLDIEGHTWSYEEVFEDRFLDVACEHSPGHAAGAMVREVMG